MSSSGSTRSGYSSQDEPNGSQPATSEIPVTSHTYVEGPNDAQNCGFHRFALSFIQRLGDYEDELRATKCFSGLLAMAEAFIDAGAGSSGSINVQRSKAFQKQMNQYFTAGSGAERSQPLADALNTILDEFRDHRFDSLPDSNDLVFSAHALGVAGTHLNPLKSSPKDQVSETNILNLWDISFSRQISPTTVPIVSRQEPAISRSRTRSRPAPPSNIPWLLPRSTTPTSPSSQSTAYSSRKRRLKNATSSPPKKRKLSVVPPKLSAESASYAEKRLAAEPLMNHALGLILEDEQLSLWWHDRESTVQSFPIDMTTELAHVIVLVILFQRFFETDWGSSGLCSEAPDGTTTFKVADRCFSANIGRTYLRTRHGRGTLAVPVSQSGHESKFFMKASFRDVALTAEASTIAKCYDLADGDPMILDHLPSVVVAQAFPKSSTSNIRNLLGLASHKPRMLQILVFDWLDPITTLKGEQFWVAFWNIIRCHFLLWQRGMQHCDISVNNIRYNPVTQKGVLNDFDLALFIPDQPSPLPRRPATGTIPFMAFELLDDSGWTGEIRHLYRHDLESFAWVLLWICVRFRDGKEERPGPLEKLLTNDHQTCLAHKISQRFGELVPTVDYRFCWLPALRMISYWQTLEDTHRSRRQEQAILMAFKAAQDAGQTFTFADITDLSTESQEEEDAYYLKKILALVAGVGIKVDLDIPLQ
ncbi:hypothetical protein C8J56DRAFT_928969 [Mycena floridula]|nr:hypothetical protein C8J56DRAFT_928969 [Mycena floridula]